jgi:RNA polymerase-binding protein DksA
MKQARLDQFRQVLLDLRPHLREEIERRVQALHDDVIAPGDSFHEPSESLDKELAVEDVQEGMYERISSALYRIDVGSFGRCLDCDREISRERLEAVPYTEYCVQCERRHETEGIP